MIQELSNEEFTIQTNAPNLNSKRHFRNGAIYAALISPDRGPGCAFVFCRKVLLGDFIPIRIEEHLTLTDEEGAKLLCEVLATRYETPWYIKELGGLKLASTVMQSADGYFTVIHYTHFVDPSDPGDLLNGNPMGFIIFEDEVVATSEPLPTLDAAQQRGRAMLKDAMISINSKGIEGVRAVTVQKD